jgi:hypothetical protein
MHALSLFALAQFSLAQSPAQVPPPPVVQAPVLAPPMAAQPQPAPPAYAPAPPPPAPPPTPAPPAAGLSQLRVLVAPCDAASGIVGPSLADVVTLGLLRTGRVQLLPPSPLPLASRDPTSLAVLGAGAGAQKVVCTHVQESGSYGVVATQLVDVRTAEVEFTRVEPTQGLGPDPARAVASQQGEQLAAFVLAGFEAPAPAVAAGPPPPAAPPVPPASQERAAAFKLPRFINVVSGGGAALVVAGAVALAAAGLGVVLAGVGHMGGQALMLVPPGGDPPRYYSALFTLTWGDLLAAGVLGGAGLVLLAAGVALMGVAFVVPF